MKKIIQIARIELQFLFYSPIAWVLLVIFTIQGGLAFSGLLSAKAAAQELGSNLQSLTQDVFGGNRGFFTSMREYLYLYVPLLTMGLFAKEFASGSIKLLQSSPITYLQMVLGKYSAMLVYCFLLIAILLGFSAIAGAGIEHLDWGYIGSALFGIFLLLAAYSAIGLFLSSLTGYQVVAAISTLAVLGALNYIGEIGKGIEFVRDITYWFAMDRHTGYAIRGLLSSKDVSYFLLIIFLFLALTNMRLQAGRSTRSSAANTMRYLGLIVCVLGLGIVTSLPSLSYYKDMTRFHTQSYSPQSVETLKRITGPVTLTTYPNVFGNFAHIGAPKFRNFERSSFEQIQRYLPQLDMQWIPYYDEGPGISLDPNIPLEEQAFRKSIAYGYDFNKVLKPEQIRERIDLSPEGRQFVRMLEIDGQVTPLRMYFDQPGYPLEREILAAIHTLLDGPVRIGVLAANEERSIYGAGDNDYQAFTTSLNQRGAWINQGAQFRLIQNELSPIHSDSIDLLIVADPYVAYTNEQLESLKAYIQAGGNMLLAAEPHKQDLLQPIADELGVQLEPGMLLQAHEEFEADLILARFSDGLEGSGFSRTKDSVLTYSTALTLNYEGAAAKGFKAQPILEVDASRVWRRLERLNLKNDPVSFREGVDQKISGAVAVALSRTLGEKEQRVFISGDADFLSKAEMSRFNIRGGNADLAFQLLRWFSYGQYPVDVATPEPIDNRILFSTAQIAMVRTATVFVWPLCIALLGAVTIIRRKRK